MERTQEHQIGSVVSFKVGHGWGVGTVVSFDPKWPRFPDGRYTIEGQHGGMNYRGPEFVKVWGVPS